MRFAGRPGNAGFDAGIDIERDEMGELPQLAGASPAPPSAGAAVAPFFSVD